MATLAEAFGAVIATILKALISGLSKDVLGPLLGTISSVIDVDAQGIAADLDAYYGRYISPHMSPWPAHSPVAPGDAYSEASAVFMDLMELTKNVNMSHVIVEAATMGQVEAVGYNAERLLGVANMRGITQQIVRTEFDAKLLLPLRYYYNMMYEPTLPDPGDLAEMYIKGWLGPGDTGTAMAYQGLSGKYISAYLNMAVTRPDVATLTRMLWRGEISETGFRTGLTKLGIPEIDHDGYVALTKEIPGPGDLITMVVREVIPPDDFYTAMAKQGFSAPWPRNYWEMHWILLPFGEVRRARHRGLITDSELDKYLVLHDYKPEPRPGIATSDRDLASKLAWDLPGRIDARWMFRWGKTDREGLRDLLIKGGLDPEYADDVADATAMNQFLRDIRMQETNIKADLRDGYITEATARADLLELGYPVAFVEYHIQDALKDRDRQHKKRLLDLWDDSYQKDLIGDEDLAARAAELLLDENALSLFLEEAYVRKYKKPRAA